MVRLRFDTDLSSSIKASTDLAAAVDKIGDKMELSAKEARNLERAAARIVQQNEGPTERYNRKIAETAKLFAAGKLSIDQAQQAAERHRKSLERAGQAQDKTFGAQALSQIGSYVTGFLSVGAAAGGILKALRDIETQAQASADAVFASLGAFGELQQVSTSPEDFQGLVGLARGLQTRGVFGKQEGAQAADLVFALRNAGYSDEDIGFISDIGASKQVKRENLQKVAEGLRKYQDIFGQKESGSIREVANKIFSAAGATQADFANVAEASTLFGSEAKALGFSDEEALAAFVAVEKQSPGVQEAATRLRSLLTQVTKQKLSTGTLSGTLESLVGRVQKGESAIDILGETRAAAALNILAGAEGQAAFSQQRADITAAQGSSIIEDRRFLSADPRLRAAALRQQAEGRLARAEEEAFGEKELLFDTVRAESQARRRAAGASEASLFLDRISFGIRDALGLEEGAFGPRNVENQETLDAIEDYMRRTAEASEQTARQSNNQPPRPSGRQE